MGITTLFKRPAAPRHEGTDSEFAVTVATLPPGAEAAVPLPDATEGQAPDSLPPDSLTFDSQPFDSQPFDSQPFDSQPPDLPADSLAPDSHPPDSVPGESGAAKVPADPFEPHPPQELPPYLGGPASKSVAAATAANETSPPAIDESTLPMADQPTIAQVGRYALKRHLGLGGLGQVHEAWDPLLSRTVAIKTLQFESDPRTRNSLDRLFLNEARAVAGLSHPNIVTVYDAGLSPQGVYLAMERLQGKDLRQRLAEGWKPGPAVVAQLVRRVADALAYAHARGVVHCDIKPGNIFITGHDKPKVLDFGIARVAHRRAIPALEGMVAGSPHYLAPEQLLGKDVDARTDVYSLGVVFYELLSGRRAFAGDSVEQITTAVLTNHPAPAHLIRSGVPEALSAVAARAMARDPEARYATASEMSADIRSWFDQPRTPAPSRQARAEARRLKKSTTKQTPSRWPWALAGASVAVLAMVSVGLLWALRPGARPATPAEHVSAAVTPSAGAAAGAGTSREADVVLSGGVPVAAAGTAGASLGAGAAAAAHTAAAAAATGTGGSAGTGAHSAGAAASPAAVGKEAGANLVAGLPAAATRPEPATAARGAVATPAPPRAATATASPRDAAATRKPGPPSAAAGAGTSPAAVMGAVQFAITPWGQIEVNGLPAGTTPPLTQLSLPTGTHAIIVRNADFPPFTATIQVLADKPIIVRHRFGQ